MKIKNRLGDADADRTEVHQIKSTTSDFSITFKQGAGTRVGQTESVYVSKLIQMSIKMMDSS
ncbi:hypothetical protein DAT299_13660 [Streptococcus suis]|nr:hypothetical protein DAT299_13660 [Streptococcus suis]